MDEEEQRLGLGVVTHSEYIVSEGSMRGSHPQETYFVQCCGFYSDGWKREVLAEQHSSSASYLRVQECGRRVGYAVSTKSRLAAISIASRRRDSRHPWQAVELVIVVRRGIMPE
jgi:hypothetical protein